MACVGISYHPYHVFYLVLSALQQAVGHLHSFFHDVFINRAIKTDFEPLFQFGFAQKTLFGNLCDCQRMAIHRNEIVKRNTLLGTRIGMYYKAYAKRAGIPVPAALEEELKHAG